MAVTNLLGANSTCRHVRSDPNGDIRRPEAHVRLAPDRDLLWRPRRQLFCGGSRRELLSPSKVPGWELFKTADNNGAEVATAERLKRKEAKLVTERRHNRRVVLERGHVAFMMAIDGT
jgi:hypothetical protein